MESTAGLVKSVLRMERCEKHGIDTEPVEGTSFRYCPYCAQDAEEQDRRREQEKLAQAEQDRINRLMDGAQIAPRFRDKTFESYQTQSPEQEKAKSDVIKFFESLKTGEKLTGLIFTGKPGTGKNHLACALAHEVMMTLRKTVLVTTALKIIVDIKDSWRREGGVFERDVVRNYTQPFLLVIDEVGVQFGSETERMYLTAIINDRYEWLRPTVVITNLPVDSKGGASLTGVLGERVIDRFRDGGKVITFGWKSWRGKDVK